MANSRNYSKEFLTEFIELYKAHPCLYMIKSPEYMNRGKKSKAYGVLVAKLKEVEPNADRHSVIRKINCMRSSFRKECKKVARYSGKDDDDGYTYTPRLWYFSLLSFLRNENIRKFPLSGDVSQKEELQETYHSDVHESDYDDVDDPLALEDTPFDNEIKAGTAVSLTNTTPSYEASTDDRSCSRQTQDNQVDDERMTLRLLNKQLHTSRGDDKFDITGKNIAEKLRNLPKEQSTFAEKFIYEVLFEAELSTLNRNSVKINDQAHNNQLNLR